MPKLLKTPFAVDAAEGFRTDIQESTGAAPNSATYQIGFPPNTMQSITAGGVPPKGSDLNGVLYDITDNLVFLTQGGGYGFDSAYATSIGGYPINARLHLINGDIVKSTIDGNTNNPNVNMTGWFVPYMRGSQNLAELTNVTTARTKLSVYSKAEALAKASNLSELTDKAVARTNLDVYSKAETDSIAGTPIATETVAGKAKIATTAIAQAGVNDTDFLTPLKLANTVFGINQTTKVGSYIAGTTYTNTTPKLIFVSVRGTPNQQNTSTSIRINVNGVLFSAGGGYGADAGSPFGCIAPVPRGSTWSYSASFASNIVVSELS